jgi:hypothetical protein
MLKFLKDAHSGGDETDLFGKEKRRKKRNQEIADERRRLLEGGDSGSTDNKISNRAQELNRAANERRKKMGLPPLKAEDVKVFKNGGAVMKARGGTFKGTF